MARLPAVVQELLDVLRGRPDDLVPFEDVQRALRLSHMVDRGIQNVPLEAIVGSLNRTQDFDRAFLPRNEGLRARLRGMRQFAESDTGYAPVHLYKVGQAYFVVDGHHRISVARSLGSDTIEAWVLEFATEVDVEPEDTVAEILAKASELNFHAATGLPEGGEDDFRTTFPAGHDRLLEHIAGHKYYLGLQSGNPTWEEAVRSWLETVYRPVVKVIRERELLDSFPGRQEADVYLWLMDRLHYLRRRYGDDRRPGSGGPGGLAAAAGPGLELDPSRPEDVTVTNAARGASKRLQVGAGKRLASAGDWLINDARVRDLSSERSLRWTERR